MNHTKSFMCWTTARAMSNCVSSQKHRHRPSPLGSRCNSSPHQIPWPIPPSTCRQIKRNRPPKENSTIGSHKPFAKLAETQTTPPRRATMSGSWLPSNRASLKPFENSPSNGTSPLRKSSAKRLRATLPNNRTRLRTTLPHAGRNDHPIPPFPETHLRKVTQE